MQEQKIIGRREGAVGHVVFNNPAKLNAVSLDMWDGFVSILKDFAQDPEIRCLVVSGSGETVLLRAMEALQGERYIALAERRPSQEAFLYGWLANRIAGG